jgi:predicted SprT family Zn-dependent metalloprotease
MPSIDTNMSSTCYINDVDDTILSEAEWVELQNKFRSYLPKYGGLWRSMIDCENKKLKDAPITQSKKLSVTPFQDMSNKETREIISYTSETIATLTSHDCTGTCCFNNQNSFVPTEYLQACVADRENEMRLKTNNSFCDDISIGKYDDCSRSESSYATAFEEIQNDCGEINRMIHENPVVEIADISIEIESEMLPKNSLISQKSTNHDDVNSNDPISIENDMETTKSEFQQDTHKSSRDIILEEEGDSISSEEDNEDSSDDTETESSDGSTVVNYTNVSFDEPSVPNSLQVRSSFTTSMGISNNEPLLINLSLFKSDEKIISDTKNSNNGKLSGRPKNSLNLRDSKEPPRLPVCENRVNETPGDASRSSLKKAALNASNITTRKSRKIASSIKRSRSPLSLSIDVPIPLCLETKLTQVECVSPRFGEGSEGECENDDEFELTDKGSDQDTLDDCSSDEAEWDDNNKSLFDDIILSDDSSNDIENLVQRTGRLDIHEASEESDLKEIKPRVRKLQVYAVDSSEDDSIDESPSRAGKCRQKARRSVPATISTLAFRKTRVDVANKALKEFDRLAFGGVLTGNNEVGGKMLKVTWSNKLRTTAGVTRLRKDRSLSESASVSRAAEIELSMKVIDSESKLRSTLLHELCHAAAWIIDDSSKPPHGQCFKKWAAKAMSSIPNVQVTTTHQYEISYKYAWACSNTSCDVVIKRHSRSIDIVRQVCGRCRGRLVEIKVPSSSNKESIDRKPRQKAPPSAYNLFIKEMAKDVRTQLNVHGGKVTQSEVMKECARRWREKQETIVSVKTIE